MNKVVPYCFLDMDGVLFDFVEGVCRAHGRPSPYSDPKSLGVFEVDVLWGLSHEEFWKPTLFDGFWRNLNKTPEADELVSLAYSMFGEERVCMLTSPSEDPRCIPEKKACIKEHYPGLERRMLFGSAKQFLAGPGRVLIDDRDRNIDDFNGAGGFGITFPRPWNKEHACSVPPLVYVRDRLDRFFGRITPTGAFSR